MPKRTEMAYSGTVGQQCEASCVNVVVVGGGVRGPALAEEVMSLCQQSSGKAKLVGIVGDNPDLEIPGWRLRYTWYDEFEPYKESMLEKAHDYQLPFYHDYISKQYMPDPNGFSVFEQWLYGSALKRKLGDHKGLRLLFLMASFGQRWGKSTINLCNGWFINTHPVAHGAAWGKDNPYRGPVPYEMMYRNHITQCDLVAHLIDNTWDGGTAIYRVGPYELCQYSGRGMYFVRKDHTFKKRSLQGHFVLETHKRMAEPTKTLIRAIFPTLIEEIRQGQRPDSYSISRIQTSS